MKKLITIAGFYFIFIFSLYAQDVPNIVFIIADDIGWNDFGCYGNKVVKTPNIDLLAKEGLQFTKAFLTLSSCSPSRCSIVFGKCFHFNGAAELHTPLPKAVSYPDKKKQIAVLLQNIE